MYGNESVRFTFLLHDGILTMVVRHIPRFLDELNLSSTSMPVDGSFKLDYINDNTAFRHRSRRAKFCQLTDSSEQRARARVSALQCTSIAQLMFVQLPQNSLLDSHLILHADTASLYT